jgi:hypothetical protein
MAGLHEGIPSIAAIAVVPVISVAPVVVAVPIAVAAVVPTLRIVAAAVVAIPSRSDRASSEKSGENE